MTGGTPDHSIIGANMNRIFGEQLPIAEVYEKTTFDNTLIDEE